MRTPLYPIDILSIYTRQGQRILLPEPLCQCTPDSYTALRAISRELEQLGGQLVLSDLFRTYEMQLQAHLDYVTGKKSAYSPPPGGSLHEAGRAFDLSLEDIKIPLKKFWEIAANWGVVPIISQPKPSLNEAWHFERRGSHLLVYDYYKNGKANNYTPYQAMAISCILAIGVPVDDFRGQQDAAYLQSCLIRLGAELGNIDGQIGMRTRAALEQLGLAGESIADLITQAEDQLQQQFPDEFGIRVESEERAFDYSTPNYLDQ